MSEHLAGCTAGCVGGDEVDGVELVCACPCHGRSR